MAQTAYDIHEAFASNLAYEQQILWDAYTPEQFDLFKDKLKALYRNPEAEGSEKNKPMEKVRAAVYTSTISQSKYTNKNLLATFILVTVAEGETYEKAKNATKFSVHLVVRTRKCIKQDDSTNCCMIFIDENGYVYQNWKHFMETNLLPKGVAFAPAKGVYEYERDKLIMDSWVTPASGLASKVVATTDVAADVGGFAAAAVTLSALALPVAAPVLAGAGVVCLGSGIYSAMRSGWQLWSRSDHEQSIAITDQQARGCWLGVASGALAVSSSVATRSITQLALAGREVSLVQETVVNGMNISTMLLSGTGVANGILDLVLKFSDDEEISTMDYLQLAASLAIFTHSAYNFRLASTIVNNARNSRLNNYRSDLSNRQRKMFDKMTKETIRTKGETRGKMDVIRLINEVPDKQYLNDMNKINKDLNKNNVRFAAGKDGHILLNDDVAVKANVLRDSVQHGRGENVLGKVTKPIPQPHATIPNQETVNFVTNAFSENSGNLVSYCNQFLGVAVSLVLNFDNFQNCVQQICKIVGSDITEFLIKMAKNFVEKFRSQVENFMRTALYLDNVLWDLYKVCEKTLTTITIETIEKNIRMLFEELLSKYEKMSFKSATVKSVLCDVCGGCYQMCPIE